MHLVISPFVIFCLLCIFYIVSSGYFQREINQTKRTFLFITFTTVVPKVGKLVHQMIPLYTMEALQLYFILNNGGYQ